MLKECFSKVIFIDADCNLYILVYILVLYETSINNIISSCYIQLHLFLSYVLASKFLV